MAFNPEKFSASSSIIEEAPKQETAEEKAERKIKTWNAVIAMELAALSILGGKIKEEMGGEMDKKTKESLEEKGTIGTMLEKASRYYKMIGKIEGGKWDELFGAEEESREKNKEKNK